MPLTTKQLHKRPGEADRPARYLGREVQVPPDPDETVVPDSPLVRDLLAVFFLFAGATIIVISTGVLWGFWVAALVSGALSLAVGFVLGTSS